MWVNCDLYVLNSTIIIAQLCIHQRPITIIVVTIFFFFFFTFTLPCAYNEAYSYVTSNSSHNTNVDFYPFQVPYHYHGRITSMCHVFYMFQFVSSTCMTCQIILKKTYTSTMENRNISKSYQMHTGSNQTDTPFISINYCFIKFSFSKASQPESPTRPNW